MYVNLSISMSLHEIYYSQWLFYSVRRCATQLPGQSTDTIFIKCQCNWVDDNASNHDNICVCTIIVTILKIGIQVIPYLRRMSTSKAIFLICLLTGNYYLFVFLTSLLIIQKIKYIYYD